MAVLRLRLWALGALAAAGCGSSTVPVSGTVSVAGKPIEMGGIEFLSLDAGDKPARFGGPVANGTYSIPAERGPLPGKYRVEIFSMQATGKVADNGDGGTTGVRKQALPPKFNEQSELTADITSGSNRLDFDLKP